MRFLNNQELAQACNCTDDEDRIVYECSCVLYKISYKPINHEAEEAGHILEYIGETKQIAAWGANSRKSLSICCFNKFLETQLGINLSEK